MFFIFILLPCLLCVCCCILRVCDVSLSRRRGGAVARLKKYLYIYTLVTSSSSLLLFFLLHGKSKLSIMPSTLSINCRNRTLVMALSLALLAGFQGLGIANLKNKPMGKSAYHLLRHFSEYVNDAFLSQLSHTHTQQTSFWLCVLLSFGES